MYYFTTINLTLSIHSTNASRILQDIQYMDEMIKLNEEFSKSKVCKQIVILHFHRWGDISKWRNKGYTIRGHSFAPWNRERLDPTIHQFSLIKTSIVLILILQRWYKPDKHCNKRGKKKQLLWKSTKIQKYLKIKAWNNTHAQSLCIL